MVQLINAMTPLDEARAILGSNYDLKFTKAIEQSTSAIFDRVKGKIPAVEWPFYAPLIFQINQLKKRRDAVILAHNYQTPQIFHGVADITGDSLHLAIEATKVSQSVIVQCGVHFMAETSKILNPQKTVLIPDSRAGCSLASSMRPTTSPFRCCRGSARRPKQWRRPSAAMPSSSFSRRKHWAARLY